MARLNRIMHHQAHVEEHSHVTPSASSPAPPVSLGMQGHMLHCETGNVKDSSFGTAPDTDTHWREALKLVHLPALLSSEAFLHDMSTLHTLVHPLFIKNSALAMLHCASRQVIPPIDSTT